MTVKYYDQDAYMKCFEAKVLSCQKNSKGLYETVLDGTAFFPEEGGQACDKGTLDGKNVLHVSLKDGIVYHLMSEAVAEGATVCGEIDFESRYRNMQHHSGEHIVSGIVHKRYAMNNVGFHLGACDMTMDYDGELDAEKIEEIEKAANRAVYENIEIIAEYPEKSILEGLNYRSKLDLYDNVRIVTIGEYDICACCAPHVKRTGEIGIIKIVDHYRYKGGTRVHALCGYDAVCDYILKHKGLKSVSAKLSAKIHEVPAGVDRILEENTRLSIKIAEQSEKIASIIASHVPQTDGIAIVFETGISTNEMRSIANKLVQKSRACAVFSGEEGSAYSFIVASEKLSAKAILLEMQKAFNVKGGGNDKMVQGNTSASRKDIEELLIHIKLI